MHYVDIQKFEQQTIDNLLLWYIYQSKEAHNGRVDNRKFDNRKFDNRKLKEKTVWQITKAFQKLVQKVVSKYGNKPNY